MIHRSACSALILVCSAGLACAADDAAWVPYPAPSPGASLNRLYDVGGAALNDVWAVGRADDGTLAVRWDGSAWTQFPTPNPGAALGFNELSGVAALAANDVIAVGSYTPVVGEPAQTLTLRFDGSAWSTVPSLTLPGGSMFHAAAVVEDIDREVWAVGSRAGDDGSTHPLAARWTGTGWEEFEVPLRVDWPGSANELRGVTGQGPFVRAVGRVYRGDPGNGYFSPFIARWTGDSWSVELDYIPHPTGGLDGELEAIAMTSPDRMVAVGIRRDSGMDAPLIMMNNWAWSVVNLDPLEGPGELNAVAARNPFDIWASGFYTTAGGERRPLLYHFDGDGWTRQPDPVAGGEEGFHGMAAVPGYGGDVWAVGDDAADGQSLTMRRCAADLNQDGAVDFADYLDFLNYFDAGDHRADFTGDGFPDFTDYLEFLNRYDMGC